MEIVRDLAAVLGLVLTIASVIVLCSKTVKNLLASVFKKYGNDNELIEIKKALNDISENLMTHIEENKVFKEEIKASNDISLEFTMTQCRSLIKNMYYKYFDAKKLPLYEYKTLLTLEDLYVNRCNGNSFAQNLIIQMKKWEIDIQDQDEEE